MNSEYQTPSIQTLIYEETNPDNNVEWCFMVVNNSR